MANMHRSILPPDIGPVSNPYFILVDLLSSKTYCYPWKLSKSLQLKCSLHTPIQWQNSILPFLTHAQKSVYNYFYKNVDRSRSPWNNVSKYVSMVFNEWQLYKSAKQWLAMFSNVSQVSEARDAIHNNDFQYRLIHIQYRSVLRKIQCCFNKTQCTSMMFRNWDAPFQWKLRFFSDFS